MRALAGAIVVCAVATVDAAPWSIELPADYIEQPAQSAADIAALRSRADTISVDAQVYLSPDSTVMLRRLTWLVKMSSPLSRDVIVEFDREAVGAPASDATRVTDEHRWVGDQLVADTVDDLRGKRVHQRRLYSADTLGTVHLLSVTCLGTAEQLRPCEQAQHTMQLTLPEPAKIPEHAKPKRKDKE